MKTQLHGAKLYGIHPWQDYITESLTENRLQIVWVSSGKTAFNRPITICFSENQGGSCYSIRAKDAAASPDFMDRLNSEDRETVMWWAAQKEVQPDYSKWAWVAV